MNQTTEKIDNLIEPITVVLISSILASVALVILLFFKAWTTQEVHVDIMIREEFFANESFLIREAFFVFALFQSFTTRSLMKIGNTDKYNSEWQGVYRAVSKITYAISIAAALIVSLLILRL